jgi:hypothetical protein
MPSIAEDRKAGIPVTRQNYPTGVAGVKLSLTEIAKRIREGSRTPSVRAFAGQIVIQAGKPTSVRGRGQAILDYVRENVIYAYDPEMTEMTASAPITLCIPGAPLCMPVSDCDDAVVAIGSLMGALGMTVRVAKLVISEGSQEHVLIEVYDDASEKWLGADFSELNSRNYPLGWEPPHESKQTMDPMHPDVTRISGWGKNEAEFIGVGSVRRKATSEERALHWDVFNNRWIGAADPAVVVTPTAVMAPVAIPAGTVPAPALTVDPYALAATDLANQVVAVISAGDTYMAATPPEYSAAVSAYQAAGQAGATSVGPEIDLAGYPLVTKPLTQQAWYMNRALALAVPASAVALDAQSAQSTAKQMAALYTQAIAAGRIAAASPPLPQNRPAADKTLAFIGTVAAAAGIAFVAKRIFDPPSRYRRRSR